MIIRSIQPMPDGVQLADGATITVAPGATVNDETGRVIGKIISATANHGHIVYVLDITEGV